MPILLAGRCLLLLLGSDDFDARMEAPGLMTLRLKAAMDDAAMEGAAFDDAEKGRAWTHKRPRLSQSPLNL